MGGGEEVALHRDKLVVVIGGPAQRCGQPCSPVEVLGRPALRLPVPGRRAQVPAQPAAVGVLGQPLGQPRPRGEQRLVGDLEPAVVHGEQAPTHECLHDRPARLTGRAVQAQFVQRHPPTYGAAAVALPRQPQQQGPGGFAGGLVELSPRVLRRTRDCASGAAGGEVAAELEVVPAPPLPGRDQSCRQERQCAGGTGDVVDDGRDELRVDREPHAGGGLLDDAAKLLGGQRRGQDDA